MTDTLSIFYLISIILGLAFQNIAKKPYTDKVGGKGVYFFSLLTSLGAMLFFIVTSSGFEWEPGLILYSFMFALSYGLAIVFMTVAVSCGSLSFTSLVVSYSLMLPTVYGLLWLHDTMSVGFIPGLVLLAASLVLINKKGEGAHSRITFKWVVSAFLSFLGNGMCSVVQKMQQVQFDGGYKNEFMIIALAMVTIMMAVLFIVQERKEAKSYAVAGWHLALGCGVMNGIVNLFVMILSGRMPVSLMFPLISAGGIVVTFLVSKLFYKENFTKSQLAGFIIGTVSVVFLNI